MADLTRLDLHERLTYWIGASARVDTIMEAALRRLWRALVGETLATALEPRDARILIEQCQKMVGALPDEHQDLRSEAAVQLSRARESRGERNRHVHDAWSVVEGMAVSSAPASGKVRARKELADFERMVLDAVRIRYHLEALGHAFARDLQGVEGDPHVSAIYDAVREGRFEPQADGGMRIYDKSLWQHIDQTKRFESAGETGAW